MVHGQMKSFQMKPRMHREITEFISKPRGNSWFTNSDISLYLRMTMRKIEDEYVSVLDLANVTSHKSGKGYFRAFLVEFEVLAIKHSAAEFIYIENVLTPQFAEFFRKNGFTEIVHPALSIDRMHTPCFYKRIHAEGAQ